jgi:GT2 family glycosyltransferase
MSRPVGGLLAARLRRSSDQSRWRAYLRQVEPIIAAQPRVHRFAQPPVLGLAELQPAPLAVWIEGPAAADARARASLAAATVAPVQILGGPLREALAESRAEHLVLLRAGDELAPLALERLGQAVTLAPDAAVITTDSDRLLPGGRRGEPHLRPGPSPDHWLAERDSGPLLVVDRRLSQAALGALNGQPGWRHGLALALAGSSSAAHAHVPMLVCHATTPLGQDATPSAPEAVLATWEPAARCERSGSGWRVRRPIRGEPRVEVIICFRDRPELLERCVGSLRSVSSYERLELALVDNGSTETTTRALLDRLAATSHTRVLSDPRPFNFSALNNLAARSSEADVLVFLNNDTEIIQPDWLTALLEEAVRPEVGAVAPLLLYGDGRVQHAGAAIGLHGYAGHPFAGLPPERETPFGRATGGTRNWLAVTAACMMVERKKFLAVGGFDESFAVAGNDVDLGLRLTAAGHRSLCVPHARVRHDESRSRGSHVDPGDFAASERSYGAFRTVGDPFYNPSLTLTATDCSLRGPAEVAG